MRRFAALTSFNTTGYRAYGRQMLDSFESFWPRDVTMSVYGEDGPFELPSPRMQFLDLGQISDDFVAFRQRHRDNPRAHGRPGKRLRWIFQWHKPRVKLRRVGEKDVYRWQAVRFCHKPFAIFHAAQHCQADVLFWLDADMVMLRSLTHTFLDQLMPEDALLSCIKRPKFSDCCFIALNLRHPRMADFLGGFRRLYVEDELFGYPEYHDAYLFDVMRKECERRGCTTHDLADGAGLTHGHVFAHCRLGQFMDHLKGSLKFAPRTGGDRGAGEDTSEPTVLRPSLFAAIDAVPFGLGSERRA